MARSARPSLPNIAQASVVVKVLGRFDVQVNGKSKALGARAHTKPWELLKLLVALDGQAIVGERLIDSLWPDGDGDKGRGSLTTTLYRLRRHLGADTVRLENGRLSLAPGLLWEDAWAFAEGMEHASRASESQDADMAWSHAEAALALYRGPFLDGEFDYPEILTAREKLHGVFLRRVEELGLYFRGQGDLDRAIALYRQGLECDEMAESLYRELMACLGEAGRPGDAVSLYRRCCEVLRAAVDIEPAAETHTLYEAIVQEAREVPEAAPSEAPEAAFLKGSPEGRPVPDPGGDRVRIAVLPFANLSGDATQDHLGAGIAEDLITDLARQERLAVVPHTATLDRPDMLGGAGEIAGTLGVRYLLEGSVRRAAKRVRVNVRLYDAQQARQIWAQRYDREWGDLFDLQDNLTREIVTSLDVKLLEGEQAKTWRQATQSADAYELFCRARSTYYSDATPAGVSRAIALLEDALALDPDFAPAAGRLAVFLFQQVRFGWTGERKATLARGRKLCKRALELDPAEDNALSALAGVHLMDGKWDAALEVMSRAVTLRPNYAHALLVLGRTQVWCGLAEEALDNVNKARNLYPDRTPMFYDIVGGHASFLLGQYDEAEAAWKRAAALAPDFYVVHAYLAALYTETGRDDEAAGQVREVNRLKPDFSVETFGNDALNYRVPAMRERMVTLMRRAGLR